MEEFLKLDFNHETGEFVLYIKDDLLKEFNVSNELFKEKFNYQLLEDLKNNVVEVFKEGLKTKI